LSEGSRVSTIRHRTGLKIPRSGIYRVYHNEHRLPHEVTLLADEIFPGCAQCGNAVRFQLIREVDIDPEGFQVKLHQIPEKTPIEAANKVETKKAA